MSEHLLPEIIVILGSSVLVLAAFRALGIPSILGYMTAGLLLGPHVLNWIPTEEDTRFLGELGVVFLMFWVGLEFSLGRLLAARSAVFGFGGAQVGVTAALAGGTAAMLGYGAAASVVVAGAIAMSSTAVVLKQLSDQKELHTEHGRIAIGTLLFQDIAALCFIVAVASLAREPDDMVSSVGYALLRAAAMFAFLVVTGRYLLIPAIRWVVRARSPELSVLFVLLIVLGAAYLASAIGISLPLGAFLAGLVIGETEFKHQVEEDVRPFRDVLLGLFFLTIGVQLDPTAIVDNGLVILGLLGALVFGKGLIVAGLGLTARYHPAVSLRSCIVLAQGGEFGLLIISLARQEDMLPESLGQPLLLSVAVSMAMAPLLIRWNGRISNALLRIPRAPTPADGLAIKAADRDKLADHVILCGYGRIGRHVALILQLEEIPCVVIEIDPVRFENARSQGHEAILGDATRRAVLAAAGLDRARALAATFTTLESVQKVTDHASRHRPDLPVIVGAHEEHELELLVNSGASTVLPESLEVSLVFGAQLLHSIGRSDEEVDSRIAELRAELYPSLQRRAK